MSLNRREFLLASSTAAVALATSRARLFAATSGSDKRLGIGTHSYGLRLAADRNKPEAEKFHEPLSFLDYCHALGAGGIQTALGQHDAAYCKQLRDRAASYGMYVEGSVILPKEQKDLDRFDDECRTAHDMGASMVRCVTSSGRRYETFNDAESFKQYIERAYQTLTMAEPVIARHGLTLAAENHKDLRADEFVALLKRIGSERIGVCLDTGNSIALSEDPWAVVDALAPYTLATHIKDMAVAEYNDGFLLSEVPIGQGLLDMPRIVQRVRAARPNTQFTLEMITRDPLQVPTKTDKYWITMQGVPAAERERAAAWVREHASKQPLPRISQLSQEEKFKAEDDNVRQSLAVAHEKLGL